MSAKSACVVELLDRESAIRSLPGALEDLAARALEPNVFYESLMLIPALRHIDADVPVWVACIKDAKGRLQGAVPLVSEPLRRGYPAMVLRNWSHRYCFLGTPLLDANSAREALHALAEWVASGAAPAGGIEWVRAGWDGPFGQLAPQVFPSADSWVCSVSTHQRALLERTMASRTVISGRHAKELRRLERRLSGHGAVEYSVMQPEDDWRAWYEEFLAVEASGWKGKEGSAIQSRPEDTAFFRDIVQQAHNSGRLQLMRLAVGGKAAAMKLNVRTRGMSYALKIGHDETYARYSPGVLLELFHIKVFDEEIQDGGAMDSCAAEGHPMINRLWSGRRQIATVTLARRGLLLRTFVKSRLLIRRYAGAPPSVSGGLV